MFEMLENVTEYCNFQHDDVMYTVVLQIHKYSKVTTVYYKYTVVTDTYPYPDFRP